MICQIHNIVPTHSYPLGLTPQFSQSSQSPTPSILPLVGRKSQACTAPITPLATSPLELGERPIRKHTYHFRHPRISLRIAIFAQSARSRLILSVLVFGLELMW